MSDCTIVTSGHHGSIRTTFISNNSIFFFLLWRQSATDVNCDVRACDCFGTSYWRFSKHLTHNSAEWGTDIPKRVRKFYCLLLPTVIQICIHNKTIVLPRKLATGSIHGYLFLLLSPSGYSIWGTENWDGSQPVKEEMGRQPGRRHQQNCTGD